MLEIIGAIFLAIFSVVLAAAGTGIISENDKYKKREDSMKIGDPNHEKHPSNYRAIMTKLNDVYHNIVDKVGDDVHNTLFGKPDVIIYGETHTDESHTKAQARAILRHKPEYTLMEALDDMMLEETKPHLKKYKIATLKDISEVTGVSLEAMGVSEALSAINKQVNETIEEEEKY